MAVVPKKPAARKPRAPARPPGLAHGSWLGDFPDLSDAELRLVECCARGEVWTPEGWDPDKSERPAEKSDTNMIRADLIRFLALGGDAEHPVHQLGVAVCGGWIEESLSLQACSTASRLSFENCYFDAGLNLKNAHLPELLLSGSLIGGPHESETRLKQNALDGDGMRVLGDVSLNMGFKAIGEVRLLGAEIGGDLDCNDGQFVNEYKDALSADKIRVRGSISLAKDFAATGSVRMLGAEIGGNLDVSQGTFTNPNGDALSADRVNVRGSFLLRKSVILGSIRLSAAKLGTMIDDQFNWRLGQHIFDGLDYDRIIGPTDAQSRIVWLNSQRPDQLSKVDWSPQPWEQLIKVLREMGHGYEAGEIAMAKQDHMRKAGIIKGPLRRGFHWLYGLLAGYGHRPVRTIAAMLTVWLACAFFFQIGGSTGYIGPGTPLLNNADLAHDVAEQCGHRFETGKTVWTRCPAMPAEYTTFQPLLYSLDLILPLVDLQQDTDWAPIVEDPPGNNLGYGVFLRWLMWFEILFGWAMSLMLVAVLGRLVEKD